MRKVALRGLLAHKVRLLLTLVAVILGVAFVSGVLTLTATMNRSFDDLFTTAYAGTDAVVRSAESFDGGFGGQVQRGTVDEAIVDRVRELPEVAAAEGDVFDTARVITEDGDPFGAAAAGPPSFGGAWQEDDGLNPFDLREGHEPRGPGEIVLDAATAEGTGYEVGDTVPVETREGVQDFTLVGVAGFGDVDSPAGANYVLFTLERAQELVGESGRLDGVLVAAVDGVSETELVDAIRPEVDGSGIEVVTGEEVTEEEQSNLQESLSFITVFFMVFAIVAVIVGSFVIYNSFAIIVAQRTREMALLRALGASRRQVRRSVIIEALGVGLVGSAAGFVVGLGLASLLGSLMQIEGSLVIQGSTLVVALLCGVVVTVLSSLLPAWRASRVPPLAAMRDVAVDGSASSRVRFVLGLVLVGLGVALVAANALAGSVPLVGVGVAAAFLGLLVAGPGLARPVSALLGWPVSRLRGVTGALARRNVGRNPRRSASTAYALMIGVGIVAFFLVINASIRSSVDKVLDENFAGDFIVSAGTFGTGALSPDVASEVGDLDQVATVAPLRFAPARVGGDASQVTGTSGAAFDIFGLDVIEGTADLSEGEVVLLDSTAESEGLAVGDEVTLDLLDAEPATVRVAGVYDAVPGNELGSYIVGLDEYDRHVSDVADVQVMVRLAPDASAEEVRGELDEIVASYPSAEVQTVEDLKESFGSQLDSMLAMVMALLAIAIVIALFGIVNTMALSVFERTRELGLLRAVGATRRQVRAAVRWESIIVALLGTTLGLGVGVLGGWGMVTALGDEGFDVFTLPVISLAVVVAGAALVGVLAAVYPSWRAGQLNILRAIHTE